jgi:hypothetical protein
MIFVLFQNGGKCFRLPVTRSPHARCISAFDKDVVVRIARYFDPARGSNHVALILDELEKLKPQTLPNAEFLCNCASRFNRVRAAVSSQEVFM